MFLSPVVGADDETKVQPTFLGQLTVSVFPTPWGLQGRGDGLIQTRGWGGRDLELMKNTHQDEGGRQPGREAVFGREGGHDSCWLSSKHPLHSTQSLLRALNDA